MPTWRSISNYDLFECFMLLTAVKHGRGSRKQCINVILVKFSRSFEQQPVFGHIMSCHFRDLRALYNDAVLVDERVTARFPPQKLRCSHYLDRTVGF